MVLNRMYRTSRQYWDIQWAPIYAKMAMNGQNIFHYDVKVSGVVVLPWSNRFFLTKTFPLHRPLAWGLDLAFSYQWIDSCACTEMTSCYNLEPKRWINKDFTSNKTSLFQLAIPLIYERWPTMPKMRYKV